MSTQRPRNLQGTIVSAELAVSEQDYHTAESALLQALSEVRKKKTERGADVDE